MYNGGLIVNKFSSNIFSLRFGFNTIANIKALLFDFVNWEIQTIMSVWSVESPKCPGYETGPFDGEF